MASTDWEYAGPYPLTYQGQPGAFSEDAALDFVDPDARLLPSKTLDIAFRAVAERQATYALLPVENTLAGPIDETFDLMAARDLVVVDETVRPIFHCLIASADCSLDMVTHVYSHPIALAQCAGFLRSHPDWEAVSAFDTAGAVEMVLRDRIRGAAAIASARAASVYEGTILMEGIQDHPENYTRFVLLARRDNDYAGSNPNGVVKTSICLRVRHEDRRSFGVLRPFIENGVPLTHVLSRPVSGSTEESTYHVDFIGRPSDSGAARAMEEIRRGSSSVQELGTYPLRVASIREVVRAGMP